MKTSIFNLFFLLLVTEAFGQATLSGKLTKSDGSPLPFFNVLLLNPVDTSFVKGTVSNELGEYEMDKINIGKYFLKYSAIGFETQLSSVFEVVSSQGNKNLGIMVMEEEVNQLNEVIVNSEKPFYKQEIDRTIINVQNSILTKGSTVLQVLERSPGVYVDRQNNNIVLNGKSGVMVMLDGKLMRMTPDQVISLLNSTSANNIERVELLPTPPSKYDAEGSAGMINIITKKGEGMGSKASVSLTGGYGVAEKGIGSMNFMFNKEKIGVYGSYSFSHDRSYSRGIGKAYENAPVMGELMGYFWNWTNYLTRSHNATLGIDVKLNSKTKVGSSASFNNSNEFSLVSRNQEYRIVPDSLLYLRASIAGNNTWNNFIANIYLEREIRDGERINFDLDYLYYYNNSNTNISSSFQDKETDKVIVDRDMFSDRIRGLASTPIRIGVAKIDYAKKINENINIEAGIKGTYTENTSSSSIQIIEDEQWSKVDGTSSNLRMQEGIGAVYSSVNTQLDPSINLIVGARYEYSHTLLDAEKAEDKVDRKIGKLFPNLFLSKQFDQQNNLQFSYTRRIGRPSYNDLASFLSWRGPYTAMTGNPWLKPTITTNLKLSYNYKGYSFSVLASQDDYPIYRNQVIESPDREFIYITPQNLKYQKNLNFQVDVPLQVTNWWSMNSGFVGGWKSIKLEHTKEKIEKTFFLYSIYGSQRFRFPRNISLEISGWYNSLRYEGSVRLNGFGMVSAGLKKDFNKNAGSLQLTVDDIFKTLKFNSSFGQLTQEAFSLNSHSYYRVESSTSQIIKLTYFKSFGNNKIKELQQRGTGSVDERGRVRK